MAPSSPILKPVGVGYAMYRMTVLLLEQVGEDNYENTYLHYNYNPAIFGFGWGPTIHVNIPRIQT